MPADQVQLYKEYYTIGLADARLSIMSGGEVMAEPAWKKVYLKNVGPDSGVLNNTSRPFGEVDPKTNRVVDGTQINRAMGTNRQNDILQQYETNISRPVQSFNYDMNSIKKDPIYKSGLESLQKDAQTATNQSLVNLGRRGIGNSQSAVTSANAQQQNVVNQANTKLAPMVIAQRYQQYMDENAQQDRQNQNLLGYANTLNNLGQQEFNNTRLKNQDTFTNDLATRQDARAEAVLIGYHMPPGARESISSILDLKRQAEQQGVTSEQMAQFKAAADKERAELFQMGVDPNLVGFDADYAQASQNVANFRGIPTLSGQAQQFNQDLAQRDQSLQETQVMAQLIGQLPDGTPTSAEQQRQLTNLWQAAEAIGVIGEQLGSLYGIPGNTPTLQGKQVAASISNQQEQLEISRQNADTATARSNWDMNPENPSNMPKASEIQTAETYTKYIDGIAKYDYSNKLTNVQNVEDAILLSGLSDWEQYKLYNKYGLKWDDQIPKAPGK